jgi:methyl-accepting chemotaxis protein
MLSASSQVSGASQSLAESTSENAASLEETSSSLEEIYSISEQNAENARLSDSYIKEVRRIVIKANESLSSLLCSMDNISEASGKTSEIIRTISQIAFQTNLLALNASVEAARAGEAGAGFAVVADEVRNLASKATESAKNTSILIENTINKVREGSAVVNTTYEIFSQMNMITEKCSGLVSQIAESSDRQNSEIRQVNKNVAKINKIIHQNSAGSEELASASEELNAQAEEMKFFVENLVAIAGTKNEHSHITSHSTGQPYRAAG